MAQNETDPSDLNNDICTIFRTLNSTYNGDNNVPPYFGIMFEISAFTDVEIKSFEVDVRWDLNPTDLSIHVFTRSGPYIGYFNQSHDWIRVASTNLVLAAEGNSGIIPASAFSPVKIPALSRQSFYISMTDAYLDHSVYGLQKTGDIHTKGDDLQLFVGTGFTSDNFPESYDNVLHPQFAGIVHYEKSFQCNGDLTSSTEVEFLFLFEKNELDASFVLNCNSIVDNEINYIFESNDVFRGFVLEFSLQKSSGSTTIAENFAGQCPNDWIECPTVILRSTIHLKHMSSLDSSKIQFEAYKKSTTDVLLSALHRSSEVSHILNLGFESAFLDFRIVVQGTPDGLIMNDVQTQYFEETTKYFLDFFTGNYAVFSLEVMTQDMARIDGSGQRNLKSNFALEISGGLLGAYPAISSVNDFKTVIKTAFHDGYKTYIDLLKGNVIRPGAINNNLDFSYFLDITSAESTISLNEASSRKNTSAIRASVLGAVLGLFLVIGVLVFLYHIKKQRLKNKELASCREQRRKERHARRLEQFTKQISVKSLDSVAPSQEIDESKIHCPSSKDKFLCSIPYPAVKDPINNIATSSRENAESGEASSTPKERHSNHRLQCEAVARSQSNYDSLSGNNSNVCCGFGLDDLTRNTRDQRWHVTSVQHPPNRMSNSGKQVASGRKSLSTSAATRSARSLCDLIEDRGLHVTRNKSSSSVIPLQRHPVKMSNLDECVASGRKILSSNMATRSARSLCDLKVHGQGLPVARNKSGSSVASLQLALNRMSPADKQISSGRKSHLPSAATRSAHSLVVKEDQGLRVARNKSCSSVTPLQHAPNRMSNLDQHVPSGRKSLSSNLATRAQSLCNLKEGQGLPVSRHKSSNSLTSLQHSPNQMSELDQHVTSGRKPLSPNVATRSARSLGDLKNSRKRLISTGN